MLFRSIGLRNHELRALSAKDLVRRRRDSPQRSLRIAGKGGRERLVPLTAAADQAIERWLDRHPLDRPLQDKAPLFCTIGRHGRDHGRRLSGEAVGEIVATHAAKAGLDDAHCHPHALRHFFVTRHAMLGTPVHRIAGHADIRTTQLYMHHTPDDLEADQARSSAHERERRRERR